MGRHTVQHLEIGRKQAHLLLPVKRFRYDGLKSVPPIYGILEFEEPGHLNFQAFEEGGRN